VIVAVVFYVRHSNTVSLSKSSSQVPLSTETVPTIFKKVSSFVKTTAPENPQFSVGMSLGNTLPWMNTVDINTEFDDIASLGITWIRIDMDWDDVQYKNAGLYDWDAYDRVVAAAVAHHLQILPVLGYTPAWERPAGCSSNSCAPMDPNVFATFAGAAASRYTPLGITAWEIWNEPNSSTFWKPSPDPKQYANLLKATYTAIKKANPSATVISGGLSPAETKGGRIAPIDFLKALYAEGAEPYFDAVGMHPYSFPLLPDTYTSYNSWSQMNQTNPSLRSIMIANGDANKKIWLTEYGAPTGGPGDAAWVGDAGITISIDHVTDDLQAQNIIQSIKIAHDHSWTGPLFIYSYKDLGTTNDTKENFFGVLRHDGSQKPIYTQLKALLKP
jgi:hypothetical protein